MTIKALQLFNQDQKQQLLLLATTINELLKGRDNSIGTFTLAAGVTTTVVTDNLFQSEQIPVWTPVTANAAAALTNVYVSSRTNGSFTLTHSSAATTDRTFYYVRRG